MTPKKTARPRPESKGTQPAAPQAARLATVLASVPGVAEQSLRATLESLPSIRTVGTAAGCLSAMQMVHEKKADLVVIDSNLPFEDVQVFLQQLRRDGLAIQALVLATTSGQVREALNAGADIALRRDTSLRQLSAAVDTLQYARIADEPEPSSEVLINP
jgi:DNA-binding NarL/FixJ family response regulator